MAMSTFEIMAWNVSVGIGSAERLIKCSGYDDIPLEQSVSAVRAGYVTWLVAVEEARAQTNLGKRQVSFPKDIIDRISIRDEAELPVFRGANSDAPLKKRLESMWGIRVAYTHSDGQISKISNKTYQNFARDSALHLSGVEIANGFLNVSGLDTNVVLNAILQVRHLL